MAIGRTRIGGGIYNSGGENVGQVYKPLEPTSKPKPPMISSNVKPKLESTFTPKQLAVYKAAKAKQKIAATATKAAEKQRKEEAKGQEKLARQKAAAERAEMYRKKTPAERLAEKYRASR